MARHRAVRGIANNWRDELDDLEYADEDAPPRPAKPQPRQPPKPQQKQPFVSKKDRQAEQRAQQQAQDPAQGQPPLQAQAPSKPASSQPLPSQPSARTAGPPSGLGLPPGLGPTSAPRGLSRSAVDDIAVGALVGMGLDADTAAPALAQPAASVEAALEHLMVDRTGGCVTSAPGLGTSSALAAGVSRGPPARASEQLNLVVVGHVDAGKSTLMGRLLLLAGAVDPRALHRCEKEANALGKSSFKYAFLLDHGADERERGVTIDVSTAFIQTERRKINVLDAPGHRDFVPNMVAGAAQADAILLVLNAAPGEFEAGLAGQTLEHIWICRCLGVSELVVAVNQMDAAGWAEARFEHIKERASAILAQAGYAKPPPVFVPVSAFEGVNLAPPGGRHPAERGAEMATTSAGQADSPPGLDWYAGPSLVEALEALAPPAKSSAVGARLCVSDAFRAADAGSAAFGAFAISGKMQSGRVTCGETLMLMPSAEAVTVKSLRSRGEPVSEVVAGDLVEAGLAHAPAEPGALAAGSVLCDALRPVQLARRIEVQLRVLPFASLVTRGMPCELYCHATSAPAVVSQLVCLVDKQGQRSPGPRPRALAPGMSAVVVLEVRRALCVELYCDCRPMGRVVLRDAGKTIAAGVISAILG